MMRSTMRRALIILALLSTEVLLGGCSKDLAGSQLVDMGVTDGGVILETSSQSCVDKATGGSPPTRSLAAPSLYFSGFSLTWKSDTLDLYIGEIKITVTSNKLAGGTFTTSLDSTEIEALLGAKDATLTHETTSGTPAIYSSTSASKGVSSAGVALVPCGLGAGGLTLANTTGTTSQFTANVKIDLVGVATNPNDASATPQTVLKSITTQVTYY